MPTHEYGLTVDLHEAADILKIHPTTAKRKALAGDLPGSRIGKRWVFVRDDLLDIIRGAWAQRARLGQSKDSENPICRSTAEKTRRTGGSSWSTTDEQYNQVLGRPTVARRASFTTK